MSARYQIFHDTHYHYDSPVSLAQQLAHLWPRPCAWQRCSSQQLEISPEPTARRDELDVFGNPITRLAFERPHDELLVNALSILCPFAPEEKQALLEAHTLSDRCHVLETLIAFSLQSGGGSDEVLQ